MPSPSCQKCGSEGPLRCSRCLRVHYCSVVCQKNDWKRHKREDCRFAKKALLPNEGKSLKMCCIRCGNIQSFCGCPKTREGEDICYVTPPVSPQLDTMQRIERWALLMEMHPLFKTEIESVQFVKDLPRTFVNDIETIRPIVEKQMEEYKHGGGLMKICKKYTPGASTEAGYKQCLKDCDFAMEHFFKGNWGYISYLEYIFLYNAIQQSGPEDFDAETGKRFQTIVFPVDMNIEFMKACACNFGFRLEEIQNGRTYT